MTETITSTLSVIQTDCLKKFATRINKYSANLVVFDKRCDCIMNSSGGLFQSDTDQLAGFAAETLNTGPQQLLRFGDEEQILAVALSDGQETAAIAIVELPLVCVFDNEDLMFRT